ncbi:MAG: hypothetical protein ACKVQJ_04910 [Pyrinomonadaceae bacterium]
MPITSIVSGVLLILIGAAGYIYGMTSEKASITALIPAFFGIVLLLLGVVAKSSENLRKHLMHAAVVIALLGFILPAGRLISKLSDLTMSAAVASQIAMASVCLIFVILAVMSFASARKNKS